MREMYVYGVGGHGKVVADLLLAAGRERLSGFIDDGLDVKILALALFKVLQREGISQPGQATVEYFSGTSRKPTGNHVKHS